MSGELQAYSDLLHNIKQRILLAQSEAAQAVSQSLTLLYWDVGKLLDTRQHKEGWGGATLPKLANDIRSDIPNLKGFSERNLQRMLKFYREYSDLESGEQIPIAFTQIPWSHNALLIERIKEPDVRLWYAKQVQEHGWSRDALMQMVKNQAHERHGGCVTNFSEHLPQAQRELAEATLKDPYIFDFLTLTEPFKERELEVGLIQHLEKFLLELGGGFAFVGRQYPLLVSDQEYFIDLLFYHLKLRAFIVIELKRGDFKPEFAGKMNFYCSVVDDKLRHETDEPTIGLILCQTKDKVLAEYALRGIQKPIGVSDYELTRALPDDLKSSLPSIEELEAQLLGKVRG